MASVESLLKSYSSQLIDACTNDAEKESVQKLLEQFEAAAKSNTQTKRILQRFARSATNSNLALLVYRFADDVNSIPKHVLQEKAKEYFEKIYPGSSVVFLEKSKGVQLGSIAEVSTSIGKKIKFYIKTHRRGLLSEFTSTAKNVDLTEIFLYKLLEQIGVGPEVHFFYENHKEFFICTRDAGDVVDQPNMSFVLFSELKATKQVENIRNMNPDHESIDNDTDQFMLSIVKIDIICRLFDMHDVLKNADNFGFLLNSHCIEKCCIIDFSPTSYGLSGDAIYKSFIEGNGVFLHHRNSEPALQYIFCSRSIGKRRELGQRAFQQIGDLRMPISTTFEFMKLLVKHDEELCSQLFGLERKTQNWVQAIDEFRQLLAMQIE